MPIEHALHRPAQRPSVERSFQHQIKLHRVHVALLFVVQRMEQQPLLQRREGEDVLDLRVLML